MLEIEIREEISTRVPMHADQIGAMRFIPGNAWEKHFGYWAWAPVRVLLDDPLHRREVRSPTDQWWALVTWVDVNSPYFDRFLQPPSHGRKLTATGDRSAVHSEVRAR